MRVTASAYASAAFSRSDNNALSANVAINPYVFHIGLALVVFGYAPHIAFIRRLTGLGWPALPDMVMYIAAAATIASLLPALLFRLTDPVLKKISRAGDMLTWVVTLLPLVTGAFLINRAAPLRHKAWQIKREQIDATGADTVVLSCASCRLNFMAAAELDQWPTRIASLVELVAERLPK